MSAGEPQSASALIQALLEQALERQASDIHLDPSAAGLRVRLRLDGLLADAPPIPAGLAAEVISRIKILAHLRTDEHYSPQDGRFQIKSAAGPVADVRVAIVPTYYGENAVLRLLAKRKHGETLGHLGFSETTEEKIKKIVRRPNGLVLVTGPTGSGKTTTLYSLLTLINQPTVSIITIEDPIEYAIPGLTQIQVNTRTGLSFESGLRSILRQDPDIIMVGEIRDRETAALAINAALTGHLVFSTLHTTDACATLPRLLEMGIDPYLIAATVELVISQRLVRLTCSHCREKFSLSVKERQAASEALHLSPPCLIKSFRGRGCGACGQSGYQGRTSIGEIVAASPALREAILAKASAPALRELASAAGFSTIKEQGLEKVKHGLTTITELIRVLQD